MKYRSIQGQSPSVSFREALFQGIAPDGTLYVPDQLPLLPAAVLDPAANSSLHAMARDLLVPFIGEEVSADEVEELVTRAWDFPIPLIQLNERIFLLELFHGPTLAFKDVGARFMAQALSHFLAKEHREVTIAVATSGDTGSAVAHGFYNVPHVSVYVLYPSGKISRLQEQQMATLGGNIHAVEVEGTFDDCQALVKKALADPEIVKARNLTTANSINLGRLIPQITYYLWGLVQWQQQVEANSTLVPTIVVPSGNFGNLTAAAYAKMMGAPVKRLVAATNANDVVPQFLESGIFNPRSSVQTLSNAMDVGNPSNLARLRFLYDDSIERLRQDISAVRVSDDETIDEIRQTYDQTNYLLDPHTAVGVRAARVLLADKIIDTPVIVTATAHHGKFPDVVERAVGKTFPPPPALERALTLPKQSVRLSNNYDRWKSMLMT